MLEIAVLIIPHLKTNCCRNWSREDLMMIWKKIDEIKVDLKRSYVVARVIYGYVVIAQWLILNKTVVVLPNILC